MKDVVRKPGFNYGVNGFRGVCVLLVFGFHVAHSGLPGQLADVQWQSLIDFWTGSLKFGVELFFMISGYVIVQSLARHVTVGAFLWDRVLRIFPAWIPVHLGLCAIGMGFDLKGFASMPGGERLLAFFANLVLLPPLISVPETHYGSWSLTYEWMFYFLASAMALIAHRRGIRWLAVIAWGAVVVLLLCALPRAIFFVPGVLIALAERYGLRLPLMRFPIVSFVLLLGCWQLVDVDKAHPWAYSFAEKFSDVNALYAVVALFAGLHLFACVARGGAGRWLSSAPLQFLGTISYSFYLWHPIVMFPVKRIASSLLLESYGRGVTTAVFAIVSLVVAAAASWVSYQLFEVRLAKTIRRRMLILIAPALLAASTVQGAPQLAVYQGNGCSGVKRLPEFAAWLGRKPDLMLDFFAADTWQAMRDDAGWTLGCWQKAGMPAVLSVPMLPHGKFSLRDGASGAYDDHFRDLARELVRRGFGEAIIRLGWEFNGGWYPWMAEKDPRAWVEYWRRIVSVMRSVPGANLRFDWCPAQGVVHIKPDAVYPGDDVVDIIGQDLYNQTWTPHIDTPEKRWDELVGMPYGLKWHREFARAHGKPESYPEWGTGTRPDGHGGGDDAYFIERMAEWIADGNVAYHGYWDIAAPDFNARLSDGHQPLAARSFRKAFGSTEPQERSR